MNSCEKCENLKWELKNKSITMEQYRQKMIEHNNKELERLQNEKLYAKSK